MFFFLNDAHHSSLTFINVFTFFAQYNKWIRAATERGTQGVPAEGAAAAAQSQGETIYVKQYILIEYFQHILCRSLFVAR